MSYITDGAIHHRNWNLLLDLNGNGGQIPSGGGGGTFTVTFSFDNPLVTLDFSRTGNLGLFDTGLGTLVSTSLTLGSKINNTVTLTTDSDPSFPKLIEGLTDCAVKIRSNSPVIPALDAIIYAGGTITQDLATDTGAFVASALTPYVFPNLTDSKSVTYDLTSIQASLKAAGGGLLQVLGFSATSNAVGGEPGIAGSYSQQGNINGSITYTYTVP